VIVLTEKKVLLRYKRFLSAIMVVLSVDEWVKVGLGPVETSGPEKNSYLDDDLTM